jgi:hypothetical protein
MRGLDSFVACDEETIIALYAGRGTSGQFHYEFLTMTPKEHIEPWSYIEPPYLALGLCAWR